MSRNAQEYIREVFRPLVEEAGRPDLLLKLRTKNISDTIKDEQFNKFNNMKFLSDPVFWINFSLIKATYDDQIFVFIFGASDVANGYEEVQNFAETRDGFLRPIDPAEFLLLRTAISNRYRILPELSGQRASDDIIGIADEDGYEGHEIQDLIGYFQNVVCLQFGRDTSIADQESINLCIDLCKHCPSMRSQIIDQELCTKIADLRIYKLVPPENLFDAITSNHFRQSFLELYRILESVFEIPFFVKLSTDIKTSLSLRDLSLLIEDKLGWRRKEEDSMVDALELCDEPLLLDQKILQIAAFSGIGDEPTKASVARRIYKIRNSIVHHKVRYDTTSFRVKSDDWKTIVVFITDIVDDICKKLPNVS